MTPSLLIVEYKLQRTNPLNFEKRSSIDLVSRYDLPIEAKLQKKSDLGLKYILEPMV